MRHLVLLARDGWKIERLGLLFMLQEKEDLRMTSRGADKSFSRQESEFIGDHRSSGHCLLAKAYHGRRPSRLRSDFHLSLWSPKTGGGWSSVASSSVLGPGPDTNALHSAAESSPRASSILHKTGTDVTFLER
jgi:hypothetical protein